HAPPPVRRRPGGIGRPRGHLQMDESGQQGEKTTGGDEPRHRHPPPPHPPRRPHSQCPPPRPSPHQRPPPEAVPGRRRTTAKSGGPSGAETAATAAIRTRPGMPGNGTPRAVATEAVARRPPATPSRPRTRDRRT